VKCGDFREPQEGCQMVPGVGIEPARPFWDPGVLTPRSIRQIRRDRTGGGDDRLRSWRA